MQTTQSNGRRARLQLAFVEICKERAALIASCTQLQQDADATAAAMEFGRATALSLGAVSLRNQIAGLTEKLNAIEAELDEPEGDFFIPFRPRVSLADQHAAVDDMAGLVAA